MTDYQRDIIELSQFIHLSEIEDALTIEDSPVVDELVALFEQGGEL